MHQCATKNTMQPLVSTFTILTNMLLKSQSIALAVREHTPNKLDTHFTQPLSLVQYTQSATPQLSSTTADRRVKW